MGNQEENQAKVQTNESSLIPADNNPDSSNALKWKLIDLAKWFVVSVVLSAATIVVNYTLKNREINIQEIQSYDKFVGVLNENTRSRRDIAMFFSIISPTEELRARWSNYYTIVNDEFSQNEKKLDSLDRLKRQITDSKGIQTEEKQDMIQSLTLEKFKVKSDLEKEPINVSDFSAPKQTEKAVENLGLMKTKSKLLVEGKGILTLNPTDTPTYKTYSNWRSKCLVFLTQIDKKLGTNYNSEFGNVTTLGQTETQYLKDRVGKGLSILEGINL